MQPTPQDNQLMSKHRVLSFKPQLRLEGRGQDGQSETEQPDHSASLGDSITSSTRIRFSVHTTEYTTITISYARHFRLLRVTTSIRQIRDAASKSPASHRTIDATLSATVQY